MRLTLWYGGAFFAAGALLVMIVYLLVNEQVNRGARVWLNSDRSEALDSLDRMADLGFTEELLRAQQAAADATMRSLLLWSVGALVAIGLLACAVGWLIAGRMLRPIEAVTATARRVADRSLHERINLEGPNDEVKRLADTFDDMLERLDRAFEGQRRFVANASHELKTPLAINRTLIEVAAAKPDPDGRVRSLADNLLAVNERHQRLIDGLLTLARSEQAVGEHVPVDLAVMAEHVVERWRGEAAERDVTIRLEAAESYTAGDVALLERLVENLVANGVRHNSGGGWVSVRTALRDGTPVLTVANSGPSLAAYELPRLFEPFRRREGTDRIGSANGTGLGLSIVDAVARAHGATLKASPREGGGLTVEVAFAPG
jgi:signal transduction histidine kinase